MGVDIFDLAILKGACKLLQMANTPVLHLYMKRETFQVDELSNMPDNDDQTKHQTPYSQPVGRFQEIQNRVFMFSAACERVNAEKVVSSEPRVLMARPFHHDSRSRPCCHL